MTIPWKRIGVGAAGIALIAVGTLVPGAQLATPIGIGIAGSALPHEFVAKVPAFVVTLGGLLNRKK